MSPSLADIADSLNRREPVVLVTLIATTGSSPVPAGSSLVIINGGQKVLGTVGGGVFESTVIEHARKMLGDELLCAFESFDLDERTLEGGMICGGTVRVLFELLKNREEAFVRLLSIREKGDDALLARYCNLAQQKVERIATVMPDDSPKFPQELSAFSKSHGISDPEIVRCVRQLRGEHHVVCITADDGEIILEGVAGRQDLIIFGGGHISRAVTAIASHAGFTITIVDDRPEYANRARFPEASATMAALIPSAFEQITFTPSSSIVIVTRAHQLDEQILEQALKTPARYIGMIGSRKKVEACFVHLLERRVPAGRLMSVHAPIGLNLGAETAEEIAVSIVSELVRSRRGSTSDPIPMSRRMDEFFSNHPVPHEPS
jgi:xanthine dehydrogenase accessory factor